MECFDSTAAIRYLRPFKKCSLCGVSLGYRCLPDDREVAFCSTEHLDEFFKKERKENAQLSFLFD